MTVIKSNCPQHGEQSVTEGDVRAITDAEHTRAEYSFVCPAGKELVTKEADERHLRLLEQTDVVIEYVTEEEPAKHFQADEAIDFVELLGNDSDEELWRQFNAAQDLITLEQIWPNHNYADRTYDPPS